MERRDFVQNILALGIGTQLDKVLPFFHVNETIAPKGKRIGMIGLDTSHCKAFAAALNGANAGDKYDGFKITIAYPYGSRDIESSYSRIPAYTEEVKKLGVVIASSVQEVIDKSDVILLETNDGKLHLEQALPVLKAGKRMFIDKPLAADFKDVQALYSASEKYGSPFFSSSSLRYLDKLPAIKDGTLIGNVLGADAYSPCSIEPSHSALYWYGIHGVEILFTVMGKGCRSVTHIHTPDTDIAVGVWSDGRVGTFRGSRAGIHDYGGTVFGAKGNISLGPYAGYEGLLQHIISYFKTGIVPVDPEETKEIYAFMTAAEESRRKNGAAVMLSSI